MVKIKNYLVLGNSKANKNIQDVANIVSSMIYTSLLLQPVPLLAQDYGTTIIYVQRFMSNFFRGWTGVVNAGAFVSILWNLIMVIYSNMTGNSQEAVSKKENIKKVIVAWFMFAALSFFAMDIESLLKDPSVRIKNSPWGDIGA